MAESPDKAIHSNGKNVELPIKEPYAGFIGRFFAFFIDLILLSVLGTIFIFLAEPALVQLSSFSQRMLGWAIFSIYFGIGCSPVMGGRTFGKRLLKISVIQRNGKPLELFYSFMRSCLIAIPIIWNGIQLPVTSVPAPIFSFLAGIAIWISLAIVYLAIFNLPTRRSLHDLAFDTFVVSVNTKEVQDVGIRKLHKYILLISFLVIIVGSFLIPGLAGKQLLPGEKQLIFAAITRAEEVKNVDSILIKGLNRDPISIIIRSNLPFDFKNPGDAEYLANKVTKKLADELFLRNPDTGLFVIVQTGVDIGFAKLTGTSNYKKTVKEWRE